MNYPPQGPSFAYSYSDAIYVDQFAKAIERALVQTHSLDRVIEINGGPFVGEWKVCRECLGSGFRDVAENGIQRIIGCHVCGGYRAIKQEPTRG